MKFIAITLLAFVATACAAPTSISDNNIGDIITVGIKADVKLKNEVNTDIMNVLLAYLNQQAVILAPGQIPEFPERPELPELPELPIPFSADSLAKLVK